MHEAPHKLRSTLSDLAEILGADRRVALCRELTKLNEEVLRTTLGEALLYYGEREPRGEYVLVVEGGKGAAVPEPPLGVGATVEDTVAHYLSEGMSRNDAIKAAAKAMGLSRKEVYDQMIER